MATSTQKFQIDFIQQLQVFNQTFKDWTLRCQPSVEPDVPITPPSGPPQLPHACYGVVIDGRLGSKVEARVVGGIYGSNNPVTIYDAIGHYGEQSWTKPKLLVQGSQIVANAPIEFYVDTRKAWIVKDDGTILSSLPFCSGAISEVKLRLT